MAPLPRRRWWILLAALLPGCVGGGSPELRGDGVAASESRSVPAFTTVSTSGAFDVDVVTAATPSVTVDAERNLLPEIVTEVNGSELKVYPKRSINPTRKIVVRIAHPGIRGVSMSGAGDVTVRGVEVDAFRLRISGAGNARLDGKVGTLDVGVSGAGDVMAAGLDAKDVTASVSGAGDLEVKASGTLSASVSGAGSIVYHGDPQSVDTRVSGAGSVRKK